MKQYFSPDLWVYIGSSIGLIGIYLASKSLLSGNGIFHKIICVLMILAILYLITRMPIGISINTDSIKVKRLVGYSTLTNVKTVSPIDPQDFSEAIRTFGNGGIFGYTGYYSSPKIGKFQMIAINTKELALVTLDNGKKYVINYPKELLENKNNN